MPKETKDQRETVDRVMHEFKHGELKTRRRAQGDQPQTGHGHRPLGGRRLQSAERRRRTAAPARARGTRRRRARQRCRRRKARPPRPGPSFTKRRSAETSRVARRWTVTSSNAPCILSPPARASSS